MLYNKNKENLEIITKKLENPNLAISNYKGDLQSNQISQMLKKMLELKFNYSETKEQKQFKQNAVDSLKLIVQNWVQEVGLKEGIPENKIDQVGGDLRVFGSFELEVNSLDSDIDTVCVVPQFVEIHKHFFDSLYTKLKDNELVEDILRIEQAIVPLIRLKYNGISFDILFCKIKDNYILNKIDLQDLSVLKNMDQYSYRGFNGLRVAEYLKKTIVNYENFQITLKLIKLWAKNRGIYSNIIGYLSGIGWTILVAKVCQWYPYAPVNFLLEKFFFIFSQWRWEQQPILIESINQIPENPINNDQWSQSQSGQSMMIITPCFPCTNTAFNVSKTTLSIIQKQLRIGYKQIKQIQKETKQFNQTQNKIINSIKQQQQQQQQDNQQDLQNSQNTELQQQYQQKLKQHLGQLMNSYKLLFKKTNFFKHFKHFLKIQVMAKSQLDFNKWQGYIESKLRKLTQKFETEYGNNLEFYPYPYPLDTTCEGYSHCCSYFYGIKSLIFNDEKQNQQHVFENIKDQYQIIDLKECINMFGDQLAYHDRPSTANFKIEHQYQNQLITIVENNNNKNKKQQVINDDNFVDQLINSNQDLFINPLQSDSISKSNKSKENEKQQQQTIQQQEQQSTQQSNNNNNQEIENQNQKENESQEQEINILQNQQDINTKINQDNQIENNLLQETDKIQENVNNQIQNNQMQQQNDQQKETQVVEQKEQEQNQKNTDINNNNQQEVNQN